MLHLYQFSFSKLWSNDIWHTEFSWNKAVRGDSMASTDGAQLEKVWEPML